MSVPPIARMKRRQWLAAAATTAAATTASLARPGFAQERIESLYLEDDVDRAVKRGVDFLVTLQSKEGAIADRGHAIAMTALSVMAMASLGNAPIEKTPIGDAMRRAVDFVIQDRHQDAQGYFGEQDGSRMYGHGIITLMLTEILGMGATPKQNAMLHDSLVRAIELILAAQKVNKPSTMKGGWRYTPNSSDSDLSVSVWQLMALRSAKNDGLAVPGEAIQDAVRYLRNSSTQSTRQAEPDLSSGFSYTPGQHQPTFTMTSAGLLALQVCGEYDTPLVLSAARWLLEHPPKFSERFFYYGLYYYAQGMHQVGGEYAETAERLTRESLLQEQAANGSWTARNGEERNHGSAYSTCLAILSLSVRYHYLPIYQR